MKRHLLCGVAPTDPSQATPKTASHRRVRPGLALLLALCLFLVLPNLAAATDGAIDPSFITGSGNFSGVQNLPEIRGQYNYPNVTGSPYNGCQLIFGHFWGIYVNGPGPNHNGLARLRADGSLDTDFVDPQVYGEVRSVYIYPHNDAYFPDMILIGGNFNLNLPSGAFYCNFARLKADGSVDDSLPATIYWGGAVNSIGVQGSGNTAKILVGGYSIRIGNEDGPSCQLVRLNYDGTMDGGFTPWSFPQGNIFAIIVYSGDPSFGDSVRLFCELPKNADGTGGSYYMLRLNPSVIFPGPTTPALFSMGSEVVDGPILGLARESTGKWLICGQFKYVYNTATSHFVPRNHVARFDSTLANLDPTFDPGGGPNGVVTGISPMKTTSPADDRMVLTGNFNTWNGAPCGYLVRLSLTGAVDGNFTPGTGADDRINRLNWNSDGSGGTIYGYFRSYKGNTHGGCAVLDGNGNDISTPSSPNLPNSASSGMVYSLATQSDGKIIVGGDFNGVGGKYHNNIARLNPNGSPDVSFKAGVDGVVESVAVQADGKILVAGRFGWCSTYARNSLARLNPDGSLDLAFNPIVTNFGNSVPEIRQVVPLSNGQMMIAGSLMNNNSDIPAMRLNNDGSVDNSFNSAGFSIPGTGWWFCSRLAVAGSNYLIAGGWDTQTVMGGGGFLARLTNSGAVDTGFYPNSNAHIQTMDGEVEDMLLQPDGKIVVSGTFSHLTDGSLNPARTSIARFSANGLLDNTFTPSLTMPVGADTIVLAAMGQQPNGKILIEENFFNRSNYQYYGTQVARLNANGSLDPNFTLGTVSANSGWFFLGGGNSILRLHTGKALVGGVFDHYNGARAYSLVRIFDGPAGFNAADFLMLLNK